MTALLLWTVQSDGAWCGSLRTPRLEVIVPWLRRTRAYSINVVFRILETSTVEADLWKNQYLIVTLDKDSHSVVSICRFCFRCLSHDGDGRDESWSARNSDEMESPSLKLFNFMCSINEAPCWGSLVNGNGCRHSYLAWIGSDFGRVVATAFWIVRDAVSCHKRYQNATPWTRLSNSSQHVVSLPSMTEMPMTCLISTLRRGSLKLVVAFGSFSVPRSLSSRSIVGIYEKSQHTPPFVPLSFAGTFQQS